MPSSVARDASNRYTNRTGSADGQRNQQGSWWSLLDLGDSIDPNAHHVLPSLLWPHKKLKLFISAVQNAHYRYCEEIDREIFWWRTIEGVIFAPRWNKTAEKKREICREKKKPLARRGSARPCRQLLRRRRVHGVSHMQVWVCAYVRGKKRDPLGRDVEERKAFLTLYPNSRQNSFFLGTMIYKKKDEVADLTDGWCPWLLFYYPDGGPRALDDNRPSTGQRDWAFPSQYLRFLLPFTTCYTRLHFSPFAYFRTVV